MKTFTSIFMGIAILAGLILALTPFVANKLLPVPENQTRQAEPEAAALALRQWFKSPDAVFNDVQAISKITKNQRVSWFSFSVGRRPIERYILNNRLAQKPLTNDALEKLFYANKPPSSWWQPKAISQQTFFRGSVENARVRLIYNPDSKRGVLLTISNMP